MSGLLDVMGTIISPSKEEAFGTKPRVETYAPVTALSPEQQTLMSMLMPYLASKMGQPGAQYRTSPVEQMGTQSLMSYMEKSGGFNAPEYYEETIKKPLMKTWEEEVMPTIGGEFGKRGLFYGSGRREAELESAESLMDILSKGKVETERMGREMGLQEMLGLTGAARGYGESDYSRWFAQQPGSQPEMQMLMQLLGQRQMFDPAYVSLAGTPGLVQSGMAAVGGFFGG